MSNTSNFRKAINESRKNELIGPNVIANALPIVGGGLILTALGTYGGLRIINFYPEIFYSTFVIAIILELGFFFIVNRVIEKNSEDIALPLLSLYSLLSGYTLSGIVYIALGTQGVGVQGIAISAFGCGATFIIARSIGSNLSDQDGIALTKTVRLGVIALLTVIIGQFIFSIFGFYTPSWLEIVFSGLGVFLFAGAAVVDFYVLPRSYNDGQYLAAALSMYLTYINLFIFILRLIISLNDNDKN
ncbi:Bax inhibitor-1/YccA family protein [Candidatus Atelocyanobacterium thalassae]|uniref:Uncharacterized protein n=1 Tax=cyanobacterium endosymbiont of Braarudosphaera bigelowii TaxID=1285375 RepID=A0ABM7U4Y9_9CHRO|nr:Bax inhibitor-1 family protein [Candidatus Atelocyanobacterium thalassa]BDA39767.1 hypothetical protein CPARK_000060700 [cyanobacterium endosymbiont of Braarudosphaera bigelowii]